MFFPVFFSVTSLITMISMFFLFRKFYRPGWLAFIPFLNLYTLFRIAGRPGWLAFVSIGVLVPFFLIKGIAFIAFLLLAFDACSLIARQMKYNNLFALGMIFFPFIFFPILAITNREPDLIENREHRDRLGHLK